MSILLHLSNNLHLNDLFHLSSTIQPWVSPEVPSSVLCTHFSPQRAFAHLRLQLSPFLRGITNAYSLPSKQLRFPMIYKMFSGTGSPNPMPHSVFLWHHLSKHRWFLIPQPWRSSHPKLSSFFYSSHYGNHSYLVFPPRGCPFLVLLTITTPICLCANYQTSHLTGQNMDTPPQHWTIGTRVYLETKLFQSKNQKSLSKFNMENWLQSRQKSKKNYQEKVRQSSHLWHQ